MPFYDDHVDLDGSCHAYQRDLGMGEDQINWLINDCHSGLQGTKFIHWREASHWKFITRESSLSGGQSRIKTNKVNSEPMNFVALLDSSEDLEPELEKNAPSMRKGVGSTKDATSNTKRGLLPDDHMYSTALLGSYLLRSSFVSLLHGRNQPHTLPHADHGDDLDAWDTINEGEEYDQGEGANLDVALASHKIEQIEITYSKAAKQVDVKALKELLWQGITSTVRQRLLRRDAAPYDSIDMECVLASIPEENSAGRIEDLSMHLCFICLLHLANEHGLAIDAYPELDRLTINCVPEEAVSRDVEIF